MKMKINRERLKKLIRSDDEFETMKDYIENGLSPEEIAMLIEIIREARLDDFFDEMNVDRKQLEKAKKRKIRLHPDSTEIPLMSTLYRNHKGKYKFEDLINEFHDSTLAEGMMIGIDYGKKFIVEDIQNNRFTIDDIMNMSEDEVNEYCNEDRETI